MKKLFNYRPIVLIFIAMCLSIVLSVYYLSGRSSVLCFITFLALILFVLICSIIIRVLFRNVFEIATFAKRLIYFCSAIFVGVLCVMMNFIYINSHEIDYSYYVVTARISSLIKESSSGEYKYMQLDDLSLENLDGATIKLNDNMKVFVPDYEIDDNYKVGVYVMFPALVRNINMSSVSEVNSNYSNICDGVFYVGELKAEPTILDEYKVTIFDEIKSKALSILNHNLEKDSAGLAYAMIFGDTAEIEHNTKVNYTSTGTAHLLAVSGLHVGFVVVIFTFLLKLLKADDKQILFIITSALLLYLIFCNFATSIIRATIMTFCLLLARVLKKHYDSLSGLALAGVIILFISPLQFFDVGFRLSFMAVLGIILLNGPISRLLSYAIGEKFGKTIAVALSANIGTMMIMITNFNMYSPLGIITNIFVVPFASLCYMFLFVALLVSLIFPAISAIVAPFGFGMNIINNIIWFGTGSAVLFDNVKYSKLINVLYGIGLISVSDYYLRNYKYKAIACGIVVSSMVLLAIL